MSALTDRQKVFVVLRLATFHTPSEVAKELKETEGVEVSLPQLARYDPTGVNGAELSEELRELFQGTRERYVQDAAAVPIAHQGYRLQELFRLFRKNRDRSPAVAAALLEQAAKETGGMFTNRREVTGKDGGPIQTQDVPVDLSRLSPEQLDHLEQLVALVAAASLPDGDSGGAAP